MIDRDPIAKETRDEAAQWYARLNNTTVSTETLREFRAWKQQGDNLQAFMDIDAFWKRIEELKGDEDIREAGEAALDRKPRGPFGGPGGKGALGVLLALALGSALAYGYRVSTGTPYATAVGEQRVIRLADGSKVRIDTDSKLRVRLTTKERRVELQGGQAFFEVAHDATRPFVVLVDKTQVHALGTRFDVRWEHDGVRVVLVEGKVRVDAPTDERLTSWTLDPGEQLQLAEGHSAAPIRIDAEAATSWTIGRLTFQNQPLQSAIDEVNRYSPTKIVLADARLAATLVSGSFESGDTEAFVNAVKALHNLQVTERSAREIRLEPAA